MERKINPLPQIAGDEPEAKHGDFLDGLMHTIQSSSKANSLEAIGADNFRGFPESGVIYNASQADRSESAR